MIDAEGNQVGVLDTSEALKTANDTGYDLVEVSPNANPPVCRLMDFGKFKYQQSKRQNVAKRHQKVIHVKEIKVRPHTEEHDLQYKIKNASKFLEGGDKVKINMTFTGREMIYRELGVSVLKDFCENLSDFGTIEQEIKDEGRTVTAILAPLKAKK